MAKHTLSADKTFSSAMGKAGRRHLLRHGYVQWASGVMAASAKTSSGRTPRPYFDKLGTLDWLDDERATRSPTDIAWKDTTVHGTPGKQGVTAPGPIQKNSLQKLPVPKDAFALSRIPQHRGGCSPGFGANPVPGRIQPFKEARRCSWGGSNAILAGRERALRPDPAGVVSFRRSRSLRRRDTAVDGAAVFGRLVQGLLPRSQRLAPALRERRTAGSSCVIYPSGIAFAKGGGKSLAEGPESNGAAKKLRSPDKPWVALYVEHPLERARYVQRLGHGKIPAEHREEPEAPSLRGRIRRDRSHELQVWFFLRIK